MGGKTVRGRQEAGQMGFAAYFKDCQGNLMGLWANRSHERRIDGGSSGNVPGRVDRHRHRDVVHDKGGHGEDVENLMEAEPAR